ncbi:TldD/PmbA family protein [Methanolobus halotolerans]|uniref:TldD/PmbA family protein n=1 Tax=Methanolobus halotolerans TaxID=2052935 RepID=A0A4E0QDP9_9EURY|nr:TldD/PmbA family protein [Methanolobus halotolerans]TGC11511.1 TldD/PmbA family protein [Methanolobus halotolerans]
MFEVDFFDSKIIEGTTTSIILDNGNIKEVSVNYTKGAGIRALSGGSWGMTSADGDFDLNKAIRAATELARGMNERSSKEKVEMMDIVKPVVRNLPKVKIDPRDISLEEKVSQLNEIGKRAKLDNISSVSAVYNESTYKMMYSDSTGIEGEYDITRTGFAISAVASKNGMYQAGRESRFGVTGYELFEKYDAFALAESAAKTALELLEAKPAKGGNMPVILDPELAGVFAHEAVGHASEADLVLEGSSILENRIGQEIASPLINVIDDPTLHEYGYYPFDDEGAQSEETVVIKDGVLNSYLHSRETAAKLGGRPGHSRAQGHSRPIVRMSNTYIDSGKSKFEEMLEEIGDGVYLIGSRGGQVNTGEGVFQFNAEKGYLIENGELKTLLRDVSLSGKILEILNNVKMVGNDLSMNSGRCGKGGQLVPVTDGSPHLLVSEAMVGGA